MKKVLSVTATVGIIAIAYFIIRKYINTQKTEPAVIKNKLKPHQHHLTNAFANAKKHAVKSDLS